MAVRRRFLASAPPRGALALAVAALAGCRTLSNQGAVPKSVATGRQLTQQGVNAIDRGDWKRAEGLLARAVDTSKADADARRHYAEALWHRGAQQEALAQIEEARRLAGEDPSLAVRAGEIYLALGKLDDASRMVDEALRLDARCAAAWTLRGRVASATGRPREALAHFQRALGTAGDDHELSILVAETYRQLNEPQRALVVIESLADSYAPGEEPQQVLYLEGLALGALGRYDDAVRSLSLAAHREQPTADILCHLAEAELHAGRLAEAHGTLVQALALAPEDPTARNLMARIAAAQPPAGGTVLR